MRFLHRNVRRIGRQRPTAHSSKRLLARARVKPEATFRFLEWLHWVWLIVSLVTVTGAVAGTHGLLLFE